MQGYQKLTVEYNQHLLFLIFLSLYTVAFTYGVLEVRLSTPVILRPRDRIVKSIVGHRNYMYVHSNVMLMINGSSCLRELTFQVRTSPTGCVPPFQVHCFMFYVL